jgi:hypothetical protein
MLQNQNLSSYHLDLYDTYYFRKEFYKVQPSMAESGFAGQGTTHNKALPQGHGRAMHDVGLRSTNMKKAVPHRQSNRVGRCISPRSLAGHEHLPVCFDDVGNANR